MTNHIIEALRGALRQAVRHPGGSVTIVLTLGLGIGSNTAMLSFASAVLFAPPPVAHGNRLAWITKSDQRSSAARALSYQEYTRFRDHARRFTALVAFGGERLSLGGQPARSMSGRMVSSNYFESLGVRPQLGRAFTEADHGAAVVVVSHELWRTRFGGDPHIVDSAVTVNGHPYTIIGVAPPGFGGLLFGENTRMWISLESTRVNMPEQHALFADDGPEWLALVGRLPADGTVEDASAEAGLLGASSSHSDRPPPRWAASAAVGGLTPDERARALPLFLLMAVVPVLVLIVACANAGNLRFARAVARGKELAVRRALGATRRRLVAQLATEAGVLAAAGAVFGVLVSCVFTAVITRLGGIAELGRMLRPDMRALIGTAATAAVATLLFGVLPAFAATKSALLPSIMKAPQR